ncbi:hypothetical protein MKC07_002383 [Listeria monocytogenes]|nr:hypothetical protein [Listeria monocytogenes]EJB2521780.1 hypothetical protein [Listeria monocytogenes]EJB2690112.1 hypothetical protein [Listeria monocytogenes]EJE4583062.1 hypothetical protein [Listeria monocytogenes]EJE4647004.1 hypothetical protein [Listeria monocytogenes]
MYKNYTTNQTSLPLEWSCMLPSNHIIFDIRMSLLNQLTIWYLLFLSLPMEDQVIIQNYW